MQHNAWNKIINRIDPEIHGFLQHSPLGDGILVWVGGNVSTPNSLTQRPSPTLLGDLNGHLESFSVQK